ncbi:hypothetical protein L3Q82_004947 [Scortum barcoo]|uniref:Uncharacterized protein n=1 Tax=Scortum barcoo TaxID=214431 RepID=A0ACB8VDH2_9TELE|nr:hypothetical protein L3Q82_004947 [Scortum barcoo]
MLFQETLSKIFDHTLPAKEDSRASCRQIVDYAIEFRTIAADSGWNTPALIDAFMNGLAEPIKDLLAPLDLPQDLEAIKVTVIRVDNRLREREKAQHRTANPSPSHQGYSTWLQPSWMSYIFHVTRFSKDSTTTSVGGTNAAGEDKDLSRRETVVANTRDTEDKGDAKCCVSQHAGPLRGPADEVGPICKSYSRDLWPTLLTLGIKAWLEYLTDGVEIGVVQEEELYQ